MKTATTARRMIVRIPVAQRKWTLAAPKAAAIGAVDISRSSTPRTVWSAVWAWQPEATQPGSVSMADKCRKTSGRNSSCARLPGCKMAALVVRSSWWQARQVSVSAMIRCPISSARADITIRPVLS